MSPSNRTRVVIADDAPLILQLCSQIVGSCPRVELAATAVNGAELIAAGRATRPDLTLVDVRMPVMDGLQAVASIRQESPDTLVVFITGDHSGAVREHCLQLGERSHGAATEGPLPPGPFQLSPRRWADCVYIPIRPRLLSSRDTSPQPSAST